jgi:transcriptional regulator with XRE-family HTH domain
MVNRDEETARRIRAARAYAGLSITELAERLGVGEQTVKRIEGGRRTVRRYELWGIADVCGLPRKFFEASNLGTVGDEAREVFSALRRLEDRLNRIEERLDQACQTLSPPRKAPAKRPARRARKTKSKQARTKSKQARKKKV